MACYRPLEMNTWVTSAEDPHQMSRGMWNGRQEGGVTELQPPTSTGPRPFPLCSFPVSVVYNILCISAHFPVPSCHPLLNTAVLFNDMSTTGTADHGLHPGSPTGGSETHSRKVSLLGMVVLCCVVLCCWPGGSAVSHVY